MLFSERQRFTQWWMWLLLLGAVAPLWYGVYRQVVQGRPWGTNPAGDAALVGIWLIAGVGLPVFFAAMHLRTEVHADRICIRFFPLHLRYRCWSYEEIQSIDVREYSPLREYGGWGIRRGVKGWAYNVRGRIGVQLVLKSGKRILIGTQEPDAFLAAVQAAVSPEGRRR